MPLLAAESLDLLFQLADAADSIAMTTLPIAGLLAELEILALEAMDPVA